jgi:hypothetical protein
MPLFLRVCVWMKNVVEMGGGNYLTHQTDQAAVAANNGDAGTLTYFGSRSEVK